MNTIKSILFFTVGLFLITGCSDDDDNKDPQGTDNTNNYFPLAVDNTWEYENTLVINDQDPDSYEDLLTVESENQGNYQLSSSVGDPLFGFTTGLLSSGTITKEENIVRYNGALEVSLPNLDDISITITNATILNPSAGNDAELYVQGGSQPVSIPIDNNNSLNATLNFTITTEQTGSQENITVNQQTFEDIVISTLFINIEVSLDDFGDFVILTAADVIVSSNYFAKDIGLVFSNTETNYRLNDFGIIDLPFDTTYDSTLTQELESYTAEEDQDNEED
ncbi:hypothetical protein GCM10009117_01460 [Gangjinia marincola]|uniref:Uncharacterized protein n=1 Tax=Gangjinia marincola TaxID=578463 RepID=A0ABP3XP04_9FLAO